MASSSSSATIPKARRYDVFLSFRGDDTRNGFTSHLREALSSSQISTFIDNNLRRGDNISPSLLTAIEESNISVIIFSEDYANSRWCLQELLKIFQCKERNGQIVIPVFYGVDPSHVRKQIGKFGVAFDKLKERLREGEMDLNEVRSHLEEAANISGWNSQGTSPESELIKSIVGDILKKLNQMPLKLPSSLVGIGSQVKLVENLLCLESPQFRMVGLWGMGGIGKTTVAKIVYRRICSRFDAFHFVENVSQKLKNQSVDDLREKIVLKLFEEEYLNMGSRTLHHDFIMKQLQCKKVLIVLDDVDNAIEAEKLLAGENDLLFSGGSRVLVTSRDKQILKIIVGDQNQIHEVEALNNQDGLQLFSLRAFKQNHPTSDRLELSRRVLSYARGNPLALVVLGCALFDKSKEEWVSALDGLGDEPFPDIQKVLRISYDALSDEEKTIFLDIASFLIGKTLDFAMAYYKGSVKRIEFKISNLVDKSLITISENKHLEMHDLLKEMGRSIESAKRLNERTRIWDLKDLINVSKKMKGSSMIEAISVNFCQGERISKFDCSVLTRSDCLRFLEFYHHARISEESKVRFCWEGFGGFPEELRYLKWDAYPHESLSSNFCAENLVELHMPNSAIRKLWTDKQNIANLKVINLQGATKLVEFPDASEGRNIQKINLEGCKSLVKVSPSIQHLPELKILNLKCCSSVESVPTTFDSKVLEDINLNGCGGIKMFPRLASANIIKELNLNETCIREVPSSVELLKGLEKLRMSGCKELSIISINICKLKSLSGLDLSCCTNLESFPEIMEPMESLTCLNLGGCIRLKRLPNDDSFHNLKSLEKLCLDDTVITELPSSIQHLICLKEVSISGCQNLTNLPSFIHNLRMTHLNLSGCKRLCSLPESLKQLSQLLRLQVAGCSNLCSLPELPSSLETLDADGCVSLKTISSACFSSESRIRVLKFSNCFELDEEERRRVLDIAFSILQHYSKLQGIQEERKRAFKISGEIAKESIRKSLQGLQPRRTIGYLSPQETRGRGLDIVLSKLQVCTSSIGLDIAFSILQHYSKLQGPLETAEKLRSDLDRHGIQQGINLWDILNGQNFEIILPWSEIPQWFCGSLGSSLTLQLPMDDQWYTFVFCVVIKPNYTNSINAKDISGHYNNRMNCYVDDDGSGLPVTSCEFDHLSSDIEHLSLWHHHRDAFFLRKYFGRQVSLQFRDEKGEVEVTRCGVVMRFE